jgi:hypothetical protein
VKTFIRVVELWLPDKSRTRLEFGGGLYEGLSEFQAVSERMHFDYDHGLPGKAWAARHPIVLKEFSGSYFQRTEAAHAAGLTCAVAWPVFAGEFLMAVLVLFCGDDEEHVGAIELWHNDPKLAYEMRLADGYFGAAEMFEFNARHTKFPPGFGLPGRTWKARSPLLIKDLHNQKRFLRWEQAAEIGINLGIGIPYDNGSDEIWVMTFLSALNSPIARRFEIWEPNDTHDALVFKAGDCQSHADLGVGYAGRTIARAEGAIGLAWLTGIPTIWDDLTGDLSAAGAAAREAGMSKVVALPVLSAGRLKAAVAWYL